MGRTPLNIEFKPLPTMRAAYSDRTAHLMAQLSQLAYLPMELPEGRIELEAVLKTGGFTLTNVYWDDPAMRESFTTKYKDLGTQGYLAEHDRFAVLVFRGTTDFTDWKTNFQIRKRRIRVGQDEGNTRHVKVHKGFYNAFAQRRPIIERDIDQLGEHMPYKPIYITGHSLGGALAQIATAAFTSDQIAACYTFGSPRAGSKDFDLFVKPPHYRIANGFDIVPFIPFFALGYRHTGDTRAIGGKPERIFRRPRSALKQLWLVFPAIFSFALKRQFVGVRDHDVGRYARLLNRIAARRSGLTTRRQEVDTQ